MRIVNVRVVKGILTRVWETKKCGKILGGRVSVCVGQGVFGANEGEMSVRVSGLQDAR